MLKLKISGIMNPDPVHLSTNINSPVLAYQTGTRMRADNFESTIGIYRTLGYFSSQHLIQYINMRNYVLRTISFVTTTTLSMAIPDAEISAVRFFDVCCG